LLFGTRHRPEHNVKEVGTVGDSPRHASASPYKRVGVPPRQGMDGEELASSSLCASVRVRRDSGEPSSESEDKISGSSRVAEALAGAVVGGADATGEIGGTGAARRRQTATMPEEPGAPAGPSGTGPERDKGALTDGTKADACRGSQGGQDALWFLEHDIGPREVGRQSGRVISTIKLSANY
jgi:hypothetical protein